MRATPRAARTRNYRGVRSPQKKGRCLPPPPFLTRPPRTRRYLTLDLDITSILHFSLRLLLLATNYEFGIVPQGTTRMCKRSFRSVESGGGSRPGEGEGGTLRNA